jgi:23S rRNA pseudouridine1911/1915/1917 synthase
MTVLKGAGEGREAFTAFEVKERFTKQKMFFVHAFPRTGRTHQIRVHLAKMGFPIVSDPLYGRESAFPELNLFRHALHAHRLTFVHPRTKERVTYEAPLAEDMQSALSSLRK